MGRRYHRSRKWPRRVTFSYNASDYGAEPPIHWSVVRLPGMTTEQLHERYKWIVENGIGLWGSHNTWVQTGRNITTPQAFFFEKITDAVYFKMRWYGD